MVQNENVKKQDEKKPRFAGQGFLKNLCIKSSSYKFRSSPRIIGSTLDPCKDSVVFLKD